MHVIRCHRLVRLHVPQIVLNLIFCSEYSSSLSLTLLSATWAVWLENMTVKTEAKKLWSASAFFMSWVTRSPFSFQRGPAFSLVFLLSFMYLWKLFLLPFDVSDQIYVYPGFSFPNLIPGCSISLYF